LLEASRANADIWKNAEKTGFRYASYFEDFMGDIFSLGFGPFRCMYTLAVNPLTIHAGVCTSGSHDDLMQSDQIASQVIGQLINQPIVDQRVKRQLEDNKEWIDRVEEHKLVVGSEARILYSNSEGRIAIAEAFNQAIASGRIAGPIMLSRDHHDVSGTDSPFRETSNVSDGSKFCADMAVHNAIGDAFRGATSVSLHNGGGTGWGEAINGGFLLLLDGTDDALRRARRMLFWDVNNGVSSYN
jgi:urocanate hydratase